MKGAVRLALISLGLLLVAIILSGCSGSGSLHGTDYSVGRHPIDIAFDGKNIWVANSLDDIVTKL